MTAVSLLVAVLMIAGLVGAVLPGLPGTPLIVLGALIHGYATSWESLGLARILILVVLAAASELAGYLGAALGARRSGGSRWAVLGAVAGLLLGLPFAPLGLVLGPMIGAIAAELIRTGALRDSIRTGTGAAIGVLAGTVLHVALALVMVGLFVWWVWRG
jgi:uncharacterized protein YqgC (DUF456 family)